MCIKVERSQIVLFILLIEYLALKLRKKITN